MNKIESYCKVQIELAQKEIEKKFNSNVKITQIDHDYLSRLNGKIAAYQEILEQLKPSVIPVKVHTPENTEGITWKNPNVIYWGHPIQGTFEHHSLPRTLTPVEDDEMLVVDPKEAKDFIHFRDNRVHVPKDVVDVLSTSMQKWAENSKNSGYVIKPKAE